MGGRSRGVVGEGNTVIEERERESLEQKCHISRTLPAEIFLRRLEKESGVRFDDDGKAVLFRVVTNKP